MRPRTDTQTDTHTDAGDHNTFCVVYDSRKMYLNDNNDDDDFFLSTNLCSD